MDTQASKFSLSILAAGAAVACLVTTSPQNAAADNSLTCGEAECPAFAPGMINHMQKMRRFKDKDHGPQSTPAVIPRSSRDPNASGEISTFQLAERRSPRTMRSSRTWEHLRKNLLHLPSAAEWLEREYGKYCGPFRSDQGRGSDLPAGRWRHLPKCGPLDACKEAGGLQAADRQGSDPDCPADASRSGVRRHLGECPLQLHDQSGHRAHQSEFGHRVDLPASAALHQSPFPERVHVGRARTEFWKAKLSMPCWGTLKRTRLQRPSSMPRSLRWRKAFSPHR